MNTSTGSPRRRMRPPRKRRSTVRGGICAAIVALLAFSLAPSDVRGRSHALPRDAVAPAGGPGAPSGLGSPQDPASASDPVPVTELDERAAGQERPSTGPVVPHPEAQEAIGRLKSPFCPGLMLEVCPSPQSAAVRDTLQLMAEEGADADSLVAWFLASYGEEWRGVPETRGRGLLAWVVPPAMLLAGAVLVVVALRRLRGDEDEAATGQPGSLTPEDERRISEALQELERGGR